MQVRDARPDDAMAIFALHVAASRRVPRDQYTDEQVLDWADKRGDGPERYDTDGLLVAERDGQVVGFGEWTDSENAEDDSKTTGEVVACYVHPDHANQGVGTALLERLHAELRDAGYERAQLVASLNAVGFYERHGYEEVERFDIEPHDTSFPVVRMEREL